jgi:NAD(P)-dependent dehydrogenase (short-subunit alcohol dehydrogenase family)
MVMHASMPGLSGGLLQGRRGLVMGNAGPLGAAVAASLAGAGAEVFGLDDSPAFDHVSAFYRADLTDPAALDAASAALPDGLDGVALIPRAADGPAQVLRYGILAPRHLAQALAPRLAPGAAIVVTGAQPHADQRQSLPDIRAAMALRWDDVNGFVARWGLDAQPARAPRLAGWAMQAWAMANALTWRGVRINTLIPAAPDGRYPPAIASAAGVEQAAGTLLAAQSVVALLSPLTAGLTGGTLAADGGLSARTFCSLDGL